MTRDLWGTIQLDVGYDREMYYSEPSSNKVYCAIMMYFLLLKQNKADMDNYKPLLSYLESFLQWIFLRK